MKLPEDKKERTQILVLIGMGVLLVGYLGYLGVTKLGKFKKDKLAALEELRVQQKSADGEINRMTRDKELNRETLMNIKETSDKYVLRPVLGNYMLKAEEIIKQHAKTLDIELEKISKVGLSPMPGVYNSFSARVMLKCGYHDLIRIIREIEADNPYLCITSISVSKSGNSVEKHSVAFNIQWPVWDDPKKSAELAGQLKELK